MPEKPFSAEVTCKSCGGSYEVIGAEKPDVNLTAPGRNQVIATSLEPIGTVLADEKTKTDYKVASRCPHCQEMNMTEVAY